MIYALEQLALRKIVYFWGLVALESQCCYNLVPAQSSAISKTRETFPWFHSAFSVNNLVMAK